MSIRLTGVSEKGIAAEQIANLPTVYLDNWALDDFATDNQLLLRFKAIMLEKRGTILLSVVTLFEACKKNDTSQFEAVLNMLDELDFAFVDLDPEKVIFREKQLIKINGNFISPATHIDLVKAFILDHQSLKPFRISNAFIAIKNDIETQNLTQKKINKFCIEVTNKIHLVRKDEDRLDNIKKRYSNRKKNLRKQFPHTSDLWTQCWAYIAINESMKMESKEWLDVFHTIIPVAYSEFVLLDKRWANFVQQSGLVYPQIAKVFNKRNLDEFLFELEEYDPEKREKEINKSHNQIDGD